MTSRHDVTARTRKKFVWKISVYLEILTLENLCSVQGMVTYKTLQHDCVHTNMKICEGKYQNYHISMWYEDIGQTGDCKELHRRRAHVELGGPLHGYGFKRFIGSILEFSVIEYTVALK